MAQKLIERLTGTVQTTDATLAAGVVTYTPPDNSAAIAHTLITARRPSNGDSAGYRIITTFKKHSGTAAFIAETVVAQENDVNWGAGTSITSGTFAVNCLGIAGATIEWLVETEILVYQP